MIAHSSMRVSLAVLLFVATPALADERLLSRIGCGDQASFYAPYALPIADAALEGGALRILVVGSSSTAGTGAGAKDSAYPARTRADLNDARIAVVARGKGGETAKGALARMMSEIDQYRPDLVVWQVGTNDALRRLDPRDVAETIRDGLELIRAGGDDVLLVDPQYFPKSERNPRYIAMIEMMERLGAQQDVMVVRRYARMKLADDEVDALLARDRLHMSRAGHECLARDLAAAIRAGLPENSEALRAD